MKSNDIKIFFKRPHIRLFSGNARQTPVGIFKFSKTMRSHGIDMVQNEKDADIVIITSDGWSPGNGAYSIMEIKSVAEEINKPVIILERTDSAKTWLRDDRTIAKNVIAIFKNRKTRNIEIENNLNFHDNIRQWDAPDFNTFSRRRWSPLKNRKADLEFIKYKGLVLVKPEIYNKIHGIPWDWYSLHLHISGCSFYRNREPKKFEEREVEVFCVNHERTWPGNWIRKAAKSEIKKWGKGKVVVTKYLAPSVYTKNFVESKMCVGCWGYGEWVHIDGYALYNKTILIKANCDYVYQWPDIYRSGETYVPCKPDYSDLTDVLNEVYSNYGSYKDMLDYNRDMLLEANEDKALEVFCKKIVEIYK